MTRVQSHVMLVLHNVKMETIKCEKKITKCDKSIVKCYVSTVECDNVTIKCEKKNENHQI